jgi:type II secretory pathway pseudopilin PulG
MAIALCIIGVVGSFGFSTLSQTVALQKEKTTEKNLEQIMYALAGFALRNHKLPTAAVNNQDKDLQGLSIKDNYIGTVPYKTLGIPEKMARDGYNKPITYAVARDLTRTKKLYEPPERSDPGFCQCTASIYPIKVQDEKGQNALQRSEEDLIAVVIISHGSNPNPPNYSSNNLIFTDGPYTKNHPHRMLWASRNNLLAVYGGAPCKKPM